MAKKPNAFLAAMQASAAAAPEAARPDPGQPAAPVGVTAPAPAAPRPGLRAGQKHLGAYFDKGDPLLERVAILRARLDMTNSALIEHALNELWRAEEARRAFGD